jgi:hypothetical protein
MFREDEITGLQVPNVSCKPAWILLDKDGKGLGMTESKNDAINRMSMDEDIYGYERI